MLLHNICLALAAQNCVLWSAEYLQVAEELFQLLDETGRGLVAQVYIIMIASMCIHANHIMFS